MNAIPLLAAKRGKYEGAEVFTTIGTKPVAWQCATCGAAWPVRTTSEAHELGEAHANACCTRPPSPKRHVFSSRAAQVADRVFGYSDLTDYVKTLAGALSVACGVIDCGGIVDEPCTATGNDWWRDASGNFWDVHAARVDAWRA